MPDRISLTQLSLHLPSGLGPSAFGLVPPPPCPLLLDIDLDLAPHVVPASVGEDTMSGLGVNYSSVSKAVYAAISARHFSSAPELLRAAASAAFGPRETPVTAVNVRATLPRALLYADAAVYEQRFTGAREGQPGSGEGYARAQPQGPLTFTARNLATNAVIGLHPHERAERQRLEADVRVCGWTGSGGHKAFADGAFEVSLVGVVFWRRGGRRGRRRRNVENDGEGEGRDRGRGRVYPARRARVREGTVRLWASTRRGDADRPYLGLEAMASAERWAGSETSSARCIACLWGLWAMRASLCHQRRRQGVGGMRGRWVSGMGWTVGTRAFLV